MERMKNYIQLHLNIMLFSLTGIFSKLASMRIRSTGLAGWMFYLFLFFDDCQLRDLRSRLAADHKKI